MLRSRHLFSNIGCGVALVLGVGCTDSTTGFEDDGGGATGGVAGSGVSGSSGSAGNAGSMSPSGGTNNAGGTTGAGQGGTSAGTRSTR